MRRSIARWCAPRNAGWVCAGDARAGLRFGEEVRTFQGDLHGGTQATAEGHLGERKEEAAVGQVVRRAEQVARHQAGISQHAVAQRDVDLLAAQVATQLTAHDALGAHARDELGITEALAARPVQAALASAATFAVGAVLPLLLVLVLPNSARLWGLGGGSLVCLGLLGFASARTGGAPAIKATARVTFWGALAMALTAAIGALFGVAA